MIINEKIKKELLTLEKDIRLIRQNNSLTNLQLESFLRNFEKARYNILAEIKLYNKNVEFEYEKIKTIDSEYKAKYEDGTLKIYIPETMPSYKNIKTHTHKRILLNVAEATKPFAGVFDDEVLIYIRIFDKMLGWDIDNKCIKPIADGLILSDVIKDDNITKMFYAVQGEYSENPHTEIYVCDNKNISDFLKKYSTKNCHKFNDF